MVQVDCTQASGLEVELASYFSERLKGVLPLVKRRKVVFDETSSGRGLTTTEVVDVLKSFLAARSLSRDYEIALERDEITLRAQKPSPARKFKGGHRPPPNLHICPHCGYVTPYEDVYWIHVKTHYV